ncbi:nitrogen regulation protein NR(II) [Paraferrimonas sedimenticola]|uniref:Sensory histidine kinase/phosphatase NtrB n=1 Tax=Paraferrimonas sedimenticola TaxID=375674 RepID=A0AA37RXS5_9GAMM|nr:nitrogen regulation protein NR(II) [Paraferrimonas sedimenticola]GLP97595.1 two-component system sensor histidine kinase NtrB [Paraferrimonas sedimenticola]
MQTELVLDSLSTAVILVDPQLKPLYANSAAEQLFGFSRARLTEHPLSHHYLSLGIEESVLRDRVQQQASLSVSQINLVTLEKQAHVVDLTVSPYETDSAGASALIELRTLDQRLKIHQALVSENQQQAAQLLVRGLAHEIKNPLGGLRGAAQLLERELDDPDLQEFTGMIIEQADRLRGIVDKLLGPQKPTERVEINLHRILEKVLRLVEMTLPDSVQLDRDYDPSIPDLTLEPDQMQQALLNIVQNAQQALSKTGGRITIRTRTHHQVSIGQHTHKLVAAISIIDDGPGVAPELVDTLFYPMVTNKAQGSGLGLSIAHTIVSQHQGRIECQSGQGQTEFTVWLPIKPLIKDKCR